MKSIFLTATALFLGLCLGTESSLAQETENSALRVFLDCPRFICDSDHFRREVPFVNYMRDRQDAQVHVLVTRQSTGAGTEFAFTFIGLEDFAGREDTLRHNASNTDTNAERRDGLVRIFLMGLIPYIAGTPVANRLQISYDAPAGTEQTAAQPEDDPWNFWVFRVSAGGNARGESRQRSNSFNGRLSANRVTEDWKIELQARGRASRDEFEVSDTVTIVNNSHNYSFEGGIVRSLGIEHWAAGVGAEATASTFVNQDFVTRVAGILEYSVFPYSESTRRRLTIQYRVGVARLNYEEITIFGVTEETRMEQALEVSYRVRQPWGDINANLEGQNFLSDFNQHRLELGGGFNVRIVRGLRFNSFGSIARIKDQIFLPGADIPEEEILLRRRQLGTDFRFFVNFGFSYTFGSIFNNVVNPRID